MKKDKVPLKVITTREAIVFVGIVAITLVLFHNYNAFDQFVAFVEAHEDWQLDEYLFVAMLSGIGILFLAVRRAFDLSSEVRRRRIAERRASALARHDPLTGLANRRVLNEELAERLKRVAHEGHECALFLVDLDQFKPVNDMYGHEAGDDLLIAVAQRLNEVAGEQALVARLGGDEFVCAVDYPAGADIPARIARQIVRRLCEPYEVAGQTVEIGTSVGVARCPADASEPEALLRAADIAMYDAKAAGRRTHRFFHADMDERLRQRNQLERDLRQAIEDGKIVPFFQPVYSLDSDRITGYEALARWDHAERGWVPPDIFIPVAEDLGLIDKLMESILRQSCEAAKTWPAEATLSINISPVQFKNPWLCARLRAIIAEYGFAPSRLIVEVTENVIIEDMALAAEVFQTLQNMGIRIALDDFGRGYSSLSHLRQLHFDQLKIDQSFVRSMDSAESRKIVSAVASLGKALGMPVTAEGVETAAVAEALKALGCERAQGFYYGHPSADIDHVVADRDADGKGGIVRSA